MANVVKRIVVEKLYDNYNYDITFNEGGVTLITGPNGYGKTTVLNIIKNALELNVWYFEELLFNSITIFFQSSLDGHRLQIKKVPSKKTNRYSDDSEPDDVIMSYYIPGEPKAKESFKLSDAIEEMGIPSHILRMKENRSYYGDIYDSYKARTRHNIFLSFRNLRMFLNDINCLSIKEQRIQVEELDETDDTRNYTIVRLAEDLKNRYNIAKNKYTDESQKIDSSFIKRLLSKEYTHYDEAEYCKRIDELNKYVENYQRFGLISNFGFIGEYDQEFKPALSLYVEDMFEKISVYDDFYRKLSLFNRFVNGKGLSNKKMVLDEQAGFKFVSDSGRDVPLHKLSSGEQNLVILYYRLVFETKPNTLLLIDEPENSLHVEWLQKMLNDYLVMEGDLGCQMIIATHSVTFINSHWDIAYDLDGGSYQN